ncbi:MAG: tetratricopeptide repeat protein [Pseudomonadota bacterium]|nr:tetratricopeptide repeat protein [Pseudomonadota bacterium]
MSLLMDALKKADKAKETHNQNTLEVNDHTLQWRDQLIIDEVSPVESPPTEPTPDILSTEEKSVELPEIIDPSELFDNHTIEEESVELPQTVDPGELSDNHTINWEEDVLPEFKEDALLTEQIAVDEPEEIASITEFNWEEELLTDFETAPTPQDFEPVVPAEAVTPLVEKKKTNDTQTAKIHQLPYSPSASKAEAEAAKLQSTEQAQIIAFQAEAKTDEAQQTDTVAETAQRFLTASAPPSKSKQRYALYGLVVLIVVAGLGGGGYYYYTLTQSSLFLGNPSPYARSFSSPKTVNTATAPKATSTSPAAAPHTQLASAAQTPAPAETSPPPVTASAETSSVNPAADETAQVEQQPEPKEPTTSEKEPLKVVNPAQTQTSKTVSEHPTDAATVERADEQKSTAVAQAPPELKAALPKAPNPLPSLHRNVTPQFNPQLSQAYAAFKQGNDTVAQTAYQQVLSQDNTNRDALLGLAAIAVRQGQVETARHYYRKLLQLYPQDPLAQVGLISTLKTQTLENESQLKLILEQMPQSAYVHFNLGNVYASHRQWAQAQQAYFNAYRYDNLTISTLALYGSIFFKKVSYSPPWQF